MGQSVEEVERWYENEDPWGYKSNPEDEKRKEKILSCLSGRFQRALDIGCGEGWITLDLPANEICGYELSENAKKRLNKAIKTVPEGKYDLVTAMGVMYGHYDYKLFLDLILKHASGTVLLCNIKDWQVDLSILGTPKLVEEFPYREHTEQIRIYDTSAQSWPGKV